MDTHGVLHEVRTTYPYVMQVSFSLSSFLMSVIEEAWIRSREIFDARSSSATGFSLSVLFDQRSLFILILRILLLRRTSGRSLETFRNRTVFRIPTPTVQKNFHNPLVFTGVSYLSLLLRDEYILVGKLC